MSHDEFKSYEPFFTNNEGRKLMLALSKPEILQNPYPYYQYLYSKGPINWIPDTTIPSKGYYIVHDYSILEELFKSSKAGKDRSSPHWTANWTDEERKEFEKMTETNPFFQMAIKNWMLNRDSTAHAKTRSLMNKVFTTKRVQDLSDPISNIANSLIDNIDGNTTFNLLTEFAYPLPILVIASLLGVPDNNLKTFKKWANVILLMFKEDDLTSEESVVINMTVLEMRKYFGELLQKRKRNPENDLISALTMEKEPGISQQAIEDNLILLLFAGHETTMNLIANGTYHFLEHPDQLSLLQNDPNLYPNAVEEALRYDSPVQYVHRQTYEDFEFNSLKIKANYNVTMMIGSANRNESSNADPDVFDITRKDIKHSSFGKGIHYCLGAPLARLEGRIAFETIFTKFKKLKLVEKPIYRNNTVFRGLESLMIKN